MGIFDKAQTWWVKQSEKSESIKNNQKNKENDKLNKHIEILMNPSSSSMDKAKAEGVLIGLPATKSIKVDYLGGHYKLPESKEDMKITILPVGILIKGTYSIIPFDEIESLEVKTESEIEKDVTLTRMVAFGIYALAMKKKKKVITKYLVMNCVKNGMKYTMVFAGDDTTKLYSEIFGRKVAQ